MAASYQRPSRATSVLPAPARSFASVRQLQTGERAGVIRLATLLVEELFLGHERQRAPRWLGRFCRGQVRRTAIAAREQRKEEQAWRSRLPSGLEPPLHIAP